jgi:glycerate kinase
MAAGARDAGAEAIELAMADGGDGTLDVLLAAAAAAPAETHQVAGPVGGPVAARLGWLDRATAIVELAEAAGLRLLAGRLDPLRATSFGAGELIAHALEEGARRILVGVGGSACTDGGAGLLAALGAALLTSRGESIGRGGGALLELAGADFSGLDPRLRGCRLEVAVDVDNPLLGPRGAAAVFAPQKGATPAQVDRLEAGLARLATVLERDAGVPATSRTLAGAGAAGGCGYGLAAIGATLAPGAALVADAVGLDATLPGCDVVITGEGRLDSQTAAGKAPIEVARRSARAGLPCLAVAGVVESIPAGFAAAIALVVLARPGEDPRQMPAELVRRAVPVLLASAGLTKG